MRKAALVSVLLMSVASQAFGDDIEFQIEGRPPMRFHHANPTIVIRQGTKPIPIQAGLTPIDKGKSPVHCRSVAGCLITAKVWVLFSNAGGFPTVSAYVDGVAMNPPPTSTELSFMTAQQSLLVPQGDHMLQSQVSQQYAGADINGWNVEYVVYELK